MNDVPKARKLVNVSTLGSSFGTGGMMTKLVAAELATAAGVATVIINGTKPENIIKVVENGSHHSNSILTAAQGMTEPHMNGNMESSISSLDLEGEKESFGCPPLEDPPHTIFLPTLNPLKPGKWSIMHALHPAGTIIIDQGAFDRIMRPESGGRLLPAGVIGVEGTWERMQAIRVIARRKRSTDGADLNGFAPAPSKKLNAYLHRSPSKPASRPTTPPPLLDGLADASRLASSSPIRTPPSMQSETVKEEGDEWELVEVGRGLANYNSIESERIKGIKR